MTKRITIGTLALGLMSGASAFAQDPTAPPPAAAPAPAAPAPAPMPEAGGGGGMPPITEVRAGGVAAWGSLDMNASKSMFAKPLSLSPDILYGVSDQLSLALVHSTYAMTGFAGGFGTALCLASKTNGCAKPYNNVGLQARYAIMENLAIDAGLEILHISDPMFMDIKAGVVGRAMAGPVMIMYNPNVFIGVTKRDVGNKGMLNIPVMGMIPIPGSPVMAGVQTGLNGPLDHFGDFYRIPFSLAAIAHLMPNLEAGAAFTFLNIAGKHSTGDIRGLNLFVGWHN